MKEAVNDAVEILSGDKGYVDLASPVKMSEEQKVAFINLLKELYDPRVVVELRVRKFSRDWRIGERVLYPREWTKEEYFVLLERGTREDVVESLGRSWRACDIKDADWLYRFTNYCQKIGYDPSKKDKLSIIEDFIKEQKEFRESKRELRKEKKILLSELERLNSEQIKLLIRLGGIKETDIKEKKKEINRRLEDINKELEKPFD